jgi:predicted RNA-binding Zn-ribbon protein involved in translation (DUF1610 family)
MKQEHCRHLAAVAVGVSGARRLRDGRWEIVTSYECPECGARFIEKHIQPVARELFEEA